MGSAPDRSDNAPSDPPDRGSDDDRPDREGFESAVEDNSERPDRAPAASPEATPDVDDDDGDTGTTENSDDPSDQAAGPTGTGAPGPSTPETDESDNEEDDGGFFDGVGDFFGGIAEGMQDFARENPRVDSHGNPVGHIDADGIQRGEVASRVRSSGTSQEDLANQLGFDSPQEMAAAQNTDFIEQKLEKDLALRAIEEALDARYHQHPDLAVIRGVGPVLTDLPILENPEVILAMQAAMPAEIAVAMSQAAEMRPDIPSGAWARAAAIVNGALQGASRSLVTAGVVSQTDSIAIGPADVIALGIVVAGAIAGGADANKAYDAAQTAIEGMISYNKSEGPGSIEGLGDGERTTVPISDLEPLHDAETSGKRPELEGLSDDELIDSVENPAEGDHVKVNTETGKVVDGNGRLRELQERAKDPNSSITPETEITIEGHTPDNSIFDWDL